jgi:hypothetical protein
MRKVLDVPAEAVRARHVAGHHSKVSEVGSRRQMKPGGQYDGRCRRSAIVGQIDDNRRRVLRPATINSISIRAESAPGALHNSAAASH